VRDLSQGQRKLVDVAIAMAFRPKLLLLDEPTSGVSSEEKHDIIKKILEIQKSLEDTTILMVEHDFDIVRYADQVFVMNFGKIIAKGSYKEVIFENEYIKNILGM
ncbi:MAG: ATP-binding cassette domain-containing protein, partial [Desulfurococcaceae archaeon]